MLMNRAETMLVNSPPRRWLQRYEAHVLATLGGRTPGATVAEIGCGPGGGTRLILDRFGAATVHAVDLDPAMLPRARRRLARYGDRVHLTQGSATDLRTAFAPFDGGGDGAYDAVFDFAIVHHIPNWRDALAEVARVLKPGGRFYFDEVTATALARRSYRVLFDHPDEDRFTAGEFLAELPRHGLDVGDRWRTRIGGDYLLGVAARR
ncbi:SAM-dependent methyltransferases [Alloactinosynnema sp. L-07]|uniref:class I SAM-dependent methyltransferase n=1 Tax=Alloactinosynnema sp. L-07 TaxID=1653480 RepID=UPI00065EF491|nr:class I SAM-dependent methyltransferase [Alloactinosynnema sp. L-07]CRK55291.1 SAM-dependent methyltransferases [Alloactinosynnema sp. L-07]